MPVIFTDYFALLSIIRSMIADRNARALATLRVSVGRSSVTAAKT
jgi:hypothetical protein